MEVYFDTLNGFKEVGGLHYRTDHDLAGHQKGSNQKLEVNVEGKKITPHVLELSFGVDRNIWAIMDVFYREDSTRTYFNFPAEISPFKVAVFPLVNKDKLPEFAKKIYNNLKTQFKTVYDCSGSIGKMYRRMDEIGCNLMITVDHDSLKQKDVTLRDVKTMNQIRVKIDKLNETINNILSSKIKFSEAGKILK